MSSIAILTSLAGGLAAATLALGAFARQELRELFAPADRP
jgi:hypothetical protein